MPNASLRSATSSSLRPCSAMANVQYLFYLVIVRVAGRKQEAGVAMVKVRSVKVREEGGFDVTPA